MQQRTSGHPCTSASAMQEDSTSADQHDADGLHSECSLQLLDAGPCSLGCGACRERDLHDEAARNAPSAQCTSSDAATVCRCKSSHESTRRLFILDIVLRPARVYPGVHLAQSRQAPRGPLGIAHCSQSENLNALVGNVYMEHIVSILSQRPEVQSCPQTTVNTVQYMVCN